MCSSSQSVYMFVFLYSLINIYVWSINLVVEVCEEKGGSHPESVRREAAGACPEPGTAGGEREGEA